MAVSAATTVALADDGAAAAAPASSVHPGPQLPIYSSADEAKPVVLVETVNPLTEHITTAREATCNALGSARSVVEDGVSRWIGFERKVEGEVKQIVSPDESLTPGLIYVAVAGLTGSVLTRTRSFPVRFLAPPVFALAALPYFLPKTAHNLRQYVSDAEDKHFPEFAEKHDRINNALELHWQLALDKLRGAGQDVSAWSDKAVESVESATGLKMAEAVRVGQERVEAAAARAKQEVERAAEKAKAKANETAEKAKEKANEAAASIKSAREEVKEAAAQPVEVKTLAITIDNTPVAQVDVPLPVEVSDKLAALKETKAPEDKAPEVKEEKKVEEPAKPKDEGKRLV
ncbi:hypothetical protein VHUM_02460 [Vanrija humicola]|uniref:MICOS complex subunit n=1 Tax=Vanrija humicola TaxID=5417 RepID=A0A7D8Z5D1_VANHU|nr:hypothetical protein VHUM_02460 [Vanrija humicola]